MHTASLGSGQRPPSGTSRPKWGTASSKSHSHPVGRRPRSQPATASPAHSSTTRRSPAGARTTRARWGWAPPPTRATAPGRWVTHSRPSTSATTPYPSMRAWTTSARSSIPHQGGSSAGAGTKPVNWAMVTPRTGVTDSTRWGLPFRT